MNKYINVKKISITLSNGIADELNKYSEELNEKKSHIIEKALSNYFDLMEEYITDKRLRELKEGKTELIDADDVWKELGL